MTIYDDDPRRALVAVCRSLYERGLTHAATGNVSLKIPEGWLVTPTSMSLGWIQPDDLALLDEDWVHRSGPAPTKEVPLHRAFADTDPAIGAIVHLHSHYAVAYACLGDPELPVYTPYFVMRVGPLGHVPYMPPGDPVLGDAVREAAAGRRAVLLLNHGPIVAGRDLVSAMEAAEELEATARLALTLHGRAARTLTEDEIAELEERFRR